MQADDPETLAAAAWVLGNVWRSTGRETDAWDLTQGMDEAVQLIELLVGSGVPAGPRLGVVTLSGAIRGVVLDAADRAGLTTPDLTNATMEALRQTMLPDSPIGNPLDGGFSVMSSNETMLNCVEAMANDPHVDCVVVQADWAPELADMAIGQGMKTIAQFATDHSPKPVVFIAMMTQSETDYTRQLRREFGAISFMQEPNAAFNAISKAVRAQELLRLSQATDTAAGPSPTLPAGWNDKSGALDEAASKTLIAAYGLPVLGEELVSTADEAVGAAARLGYPVVVKVASETITHKSDVGGVALDLRDEAAVRAAFARIADNVARHGLTADRMLIAPMVHGGVEIALGVMAKLR
jgi:acetate---CoA ligase (ADP-forming)